MNKILVLLKTSYINKLKINQLTKSSKGDKLKILGMGVVILWAAIVLLVSAVGGFALMAEELNKLDLLDTLLYQSYLMAFAIVFFTTIYKSQGTLFTMKDFDMLMSLPLKKSQILASKILDMVITNIFFMGLFIVPISIVYYNYSDVSPIFFVNLIILLLFIPLIPIVISSLLGLVVAFISSKMRSKSLVMILGSLILTLGILVIPSFAGDYINNLAANSTKISDVLGKVLPQSVWFVEGVTGENYLSMIIFIAVSLIIFGVFLVLFSRTFASINMKLGETYQKNNYKMKSLKTSSPVMALTKKEFKRYLSSPIYVMNTAIMPVLSTIMVIALMFFGEDIISQMVGTNIDSSMISNIVILALTLLSAFQTTTASSISLEGKNFWILKSSPIKFRDIVISKSLVNITVLVPLNIINAILLSFILKFSIVQTIIIILIPNLVVVLMSFIGLIVNLYLPRFDFTTDTQVVKQSASVLVVMLLGMALVGIPTYLYTLLSMDINAYFIICFVLLGALSAASWGFLNTKGQKIFRNLE